MSSAPPDELQAEHTVNGASSWKVTFEEKNGIFLKKFFFLI